MKKIGLMMAATMAATMMGAAAHADTLMFNYVEDGNSASWTQDSNPMPLISYEGGTNIAVSNASSSFQEFTEVDFFTANDEGMFNLVYAGTSYSVYGPQVFTGTTDSPVFQPGVFQATSSDSGMPGTLTITDMSAVSAAPEPSVWALMLAGVAMIGLTLRQGRRQNGTAIA